MPRRLVRPSLVPGALGAGIFAALAAAMAALGALGALPGLTRTASANGRPPGTSSIAFRQGHESDIVAGLTFGMVISHDGGATWSWICEDVLGLPLNSPYDPIFTYTAAGSVFATTTPGLIVMRDGCTFNPAASGGTFVSTTTVGPGAFYYAASEAGTNGKTPDFKVYKSTDDGVTFPLSVRPDPATDTNVWWESLMAAPANPQILYLSGYRVLQGTGGQRDHLLYRSDNGGMSWSQLATAGHGMTLVQNSLIHIVGTASGDAMHVYARVEYIDNTTSDALYVSADGGVSWTPMLTHPDRFLAFVARTTVHNGHHDLLTTTTKFGNEISHDDGKTWGPLAGAPHINCLVENSAGELWACTRNYDVGQVGSDDAGIMKTTDLSAWTKVLRYQDLVGPVATCGADTIQQKTCNQKDLWCGVCAQLMCTPAASYACPSPPSDVPVSPPMTKGGCCDTGAGPGGPLALALSVATLLWRPRRRTLR